MAQSGSRYPIKERVLIPVMPYSPIWRQDRQLEMEEVIVFDRKGDWAIVPSFDLQDENPDELKILHIPSGLGVGLGSKNITPLRKALAGLPADSGFTSAPELVDGKMSDKERTLWMAENKAAIDSIHELVRTIQREVKGLL